MTDQNLTEMQIDLMRYLTYNPDSGIFTWNFSPSSNVKVGAVAGSLQVKGDIAVSLNKKVYKLHRLAFLYMTGELPPEGMQVDHINRVASDNRWCNLRLVTPGQNNLNRGLKSTNKSGIRGLRKINTTTKTYSYRAKITVKGQDYVKDLTGLHAQEDEIIQALSEWLRVMRSALHGEFSPREDL